MVQETNSLRAYRYAEAKFKETQQYLNAEINVINNIHDYRLTSKFLEQFPGRVKEVVFKKAGNKDVSMLNADVKERLTISRISYLNDVADELESESKYYSPMDGSFWESFGECLKKLSLEVRAQI